jgi:hypothetical protein
MKYPWTLETMQKINDLTPTITGKAFDPDWFLLRQRFEQAEEKLFSFGQEWDGTRFVFNGKE